MRGAGFGLLGLLIVAAIIFWISYGPMGKNAPNGYVGQVQKTGQEARDEVNQISGHNDDGTPIADSIKLEPVNDSDGHLRRLKVISVVPGSLVDQGYHLQAGDEITQAGDYDVQTNGDDTGTFIIAQMQNNRAVTFRRNGQTMTTAPDTTLTRKHPDLFGKPGTTGGAAVPSH
jgi:hypothetical protein